MLTEGVRLRSGRYELERELGRGAAATVWLATDTLLERRVAVKVLAEGLADDHGWLARFRREARIAARLQHPNLVSIYDFEADVDRPYLVMAYLPGGSLEERLDADTCPDPERLATDLLRALEHIHAAGIIHRDVKPGNVLLARDGRACLTDFGVARPQDATSITQTGQIPGTARYMAPELWRGSPADERSDLFSCGVLLARCLRDDSPARLTGLVERMSAEGAELRPESAAAALRVLGATAPSEPDTVEHRFVPALDEEPDSAGDHPPPATRALRAGTPRWLPVAALCLVALLAGIAFANAIDGGEDAPAPSTGTAREGEGGGSESREQPQDSPPAAPAGEPPAPEPGQDPVALNDEGKALIDSGQPEAAIPLLQQAVAGLEDTPDDLNYAYALYNLGNALRLSGRPEEAIPILKRRLQIPNQQSVVAAELKQAKSDLKASRKAD